MNDYKGLIVVALGGNAISQANEEGNVSQQFANSRRTAIQLVDLIQQGYQIVVTHGNGPQIGNFLLRNELAAGTIYSLPMEVAVAHVQGGMGFMIAQTLMNECNSRGMTDSVITAFITTVLVDLDDLAFKHPTKPVGRILNKEEADQYIAKDKWTMKEIKPGQFRRVVPSPKPQQIMEIETIRRSVVAGDIVIACGGGGVPVVKDPKWGVRGERAVIDKDLASAMLARQLGADALVILTAVPKVSINFGQPDQRDLDRITLTEAKRWHEEGQFPPGSMGPKIAGAIEFLEASVKPHAQAIMGHHDHACDAVAGKTGTAIVKELKVGTLDLSD